ncbi:DUF6056 family protein [Latilactobacillus sakei]|uniref:DUF6056 family protein n=1 Tax=Latilactobacillus sakei TaxID=1599 RepID=UPI002073ABB0|nr:DUF6056 family protein [Latilactobacillus sakei]USG06608.1 hypothetical protein A4W88_08310 [Latilactobacillus sakei]
MTVRNNEAIKKYGFFFLVFIFFGYLSINFPLTGDDLNWGITTLKNYFGSGQFLNYDGRYAGNSLIIIASHSAVFKVLSYAGITTLVVYLAAHLINNVRQLERNTLLILILVLTMSTELFAQVLGWNAGFFNYMASLVYPLIIINLVKYHYSDWQASKYLRYSILIAVLSIISCFFVEHVTLLNLAVATILMGYMLYQKKKNYLVIANFIGTYIGGILMFSNKAYLNILLHHDSYRETSFSLTKVYHIISQQMDFYLLIDNPIITVLLAVILGYLIIKNLQKRSGNKLGTVVSYLELSILIAFIEFHYILFNTFLKDFGHRYLVSCLLSILFLLVIVIEMAKLSLETHNIEYIALIAAAIVLIVPFFVVTPFGPRGAFASYFCLCLLVVALCNELNAVKFSLPIIRIMMVMVVIFYAGLATRIGHASRIKNDFITYQEKHNTPKDYRLYLEVPYNQYYWAVHPQATDSSYRGYYKIKTIGGKLVPYAKWRLIEKNTNSNAEMFSQVLKVDSQNK